jgi:hypothetical protein
MANTMHHTIPYQRSLRHSKITAIAPVGRGGLLAKRREQIEKDDAPSRSTEEPSRETLLTSNVVHILLLMKELGLARLLPEDESDPGHGSYCPPGKYFDLIYE